MKCLHLDVELPICVVRVGEGVRARTRPLALAGAIFVLKGDASAVRVTQSRTLGDRRAGSATKLVATGATSSVIRCIARAVLDVQVCAV